jgi:neutral ceramidase
VGNGEISADYYGMFCSALARLNGVKDDEFPPFVPILANGTSGDINNVNFRTPRPSSPPYAQMRKVAEDVAAKVQAALAGTEWKDEAELEARFRELELSWRVVSPETLAWAKEKLPNADVPSVKADLPAIYARRVQQLSAAEGPARIPLQALRIGDICIGTFPCETFAETGLEFKKRSPLKHSFMVELNHGYFGYLPTPRHFELGGYETWPGTNSLEPQAAVKMLDALLELAGELKR